jgi:hypothetical protein
MSNPELHTMTLTVEVSPWADRVVSFIARHPMAFQWIGIERLAWVIVRLFVRVKAA